MRGRALDVEHVYVAPNSFADMVHNTGTWVPHYASKAPVFVVSLGLLPRSRQQFSRLATEAAEASFHAQKWEASYEPAVG